MSREDLGLEKSLEGWESAEPELKPGNSSGYAGVTLSGDKKRWQAQIEFSDSTVCLGTCDINDEKRKKELAQKFVHFRTKKRSVPCTLSLRR